MIVRSGRFVLRFGASSGGGRSRPGWTRPAHRAPTTASPGATRGPRHHGSSDFSLSPAAFVGSAMRTVRPSRPSPEDGPHGGPYADRRSRRETAPGARTRLRRRSRAIARRRKLRPTIDRGRSATGSRPPGGPSAGGGGRGRRRLRGIERVEDRIDEAVVVHQGAEAPTKKVRHRSTSRLNTGWTFSSRIETTLAVPPRRRISSPDLELAGHRPALAHLPEPVDRRGDERLVARGRSAAWASACCDATRRPARSRGRRW